MNKSGIFFLILLLATGITAFHKSIFPIRTIEIQGTEFLKKEIIETLVDKNQSLFSLKKDELAQKIQELGFSDKVQISIQLLDKLVIQIQEKSIVGSIYHNNKKYYLTSKGLVLSEKNYILDKNIPEIKIKNKLENSKLMILCKNLELIKFYDSNFFSKIDKISFDGLENSNIFIRINKKEYVLNSIFKLEDFLKIRLLEKQNLSYRFFDLRENDMIVVKN